MKKHVILFTVMTLSLSWCYQYWLISNDGLKQFGLYGLVVLMWIPGVVSLLYRWVAGLGFKDIGFQKTALRFYVLAIGIPLILALVTNVISIPLGMKSWAMWSWEAFRPKLGLVLFALVMGFFGALGEEIGWRGFLLPKMLEAKISKPYVFSGLIWAIWHLPLVTMGGYYQSASPTLIAAVYTLTIITSGCLIGLLRIHSGSIWVATLFHTCHNFFFQLLIPHILIAGTGPNEKWWDVVGSDCGLIVGLLYLITLLGYKSFYEKKYSH